MTKHPLVLLLLLVLLLASCTRSPTEKPRNAPLAKTPAVPAPDTVVRMDPPAGKGAMGINLMTSEDRIYATWLEPVENTRGDGVKIFRLRLATYAKGTWSAPATVTESAALVANWADFPSVARSTNGHLVAHVAEETGLEGYDVVLYRSEDGSSWARLGRAHDDVAGHGTEHGFVSLLPEGDAVRAFWLDGREQAGGHGHSGGPMTLRTALIATSVAEGAVLDARVCDCCGTSAAMTSEGPVLVYRDRSEDELRDIAIVRVGKAGADGPRTVHHDGWRVAGCPVNGPAVAAEGPRVAVAWYTYAESQHRVRVAFSGDAGKSFGSPIEVDGPRGRRAPLGRVDVVLDSRGALVSWIAVEREDAALWVRRVTPGGDLGREVLITPTRAGRDSGFPRMERLADVLVFAWTEVGQESHVRAASWPISAVPPAEGRSAPQAAAPAASPKISAVVPDIRAMTLDGKEASLQALRGQAVLVNVWATWCEPCRHELPELAALHTRFAKAGLNVVGVSVDRDLSTQGVAEFVARRKLPFPVWHDRADQISQLLGVTTLPASFVVDRRGALVWRSVGAVSASDTALIAAIERALARP